MTIEFQSHLTFLNRWSNKNPGKDETICCYMVCKTLYEVKVLSVLSTLTLWEHLFVRYWTVKQIKTIFHFKQNFPLKKINLIQGVVVDKHHFQNFKNRVWTLKLARGYSTVLSTYSSEFFLLNFHQVLFYANACVALSNHKWAYT